MTFFPVAVVLGLFNFDRTPAALVSGCLTVVVVVVFTTVVVLVVVALPPVGAVLPDGVDMIKIFL